MSPPVGLKCIGAFLRPRESVVVLEFTPLDSLHMQTVELLMSDARTLHAELKRVLSSAEGVDAGKSSE